METRSLALFKICSAQDLAAAVAFAQSVSRALGFPLEERTAIALATMEGAARIDPTPVLIEFLEKQESVHKLVVRIPGSSESLFEFVIPSGAPSLELIATHDGSPDMREFSQDVRETIQSIRDTHQQLDRSRSMVASLEAELEETNRGVLALYAELDDRADKLKRADILKSQFLSYASHELRTPLNGIVGLVRMLMSSAEPRPHEDNKQLSFIKGAAEEMREMVNDLLDLAKVEAGKITITPTEFDLDFVFRALRGMFRPLLQTDDTLLIFGDTSAVPSIYSDEAKVAQILRNFISNALKFTEKGEIHVWAQLANDGLRISVSDTGIGVSPENLSTIFDEYSQVDGPLQKRVKGTGLGLPLCKKFAELLGGSIEVASELGKGSTFTLVLPPKFEARKRFAKSAGAESEPTLPKLLIIDDMEIDRYLLIHLLKGGGNYNILQAADGRAGLDVALSELPDMIFLDLNMPKLDGLGVLAALRENFSTAAIPIVIVTTRVLSPVDLNKMRETTLAVLSKEALSSAEKILIELVPNASIDVVAASGEMQSL